MYLGSTYLIVDDFAKSIEFYEKLLEMTVSKKNMERFGMFDYEGSCIALMNAHFDTENPQKVVHKGEYVEYFDDLEQIAGLPNTRKFVLNFGTDDLRAEYDRIKKLNISEKISKIKYVCNASPYYYFQLTDPDGNIMEVTGNYTPEEGEFE